MSWLLELGGQSRDRRATPANGRALHKSQDTADEAHDDVRCNFRQG